jgi:hypothetical protein
VTVKTSHGRFEFPNQRFADQTGEKRVTWLEYTEQFQECVESERVRSRCGSYANRMSYHEVAKLFRDETGSDVVRSQRIQEIGGEEANRLSAAMAKHASRTLASGAALPAIHQRVDIYDAQREEVFLFDDGIHVNKQKETRKKPSK